MVRSIAQFLTSLCQWFSWSTFIQSSNPGILYLIPILYGYSYMSCLTYLYILYQEITALERGLLEDRYSIKRNWWICYKFYFLIVGYFVCIIQYLDHLQKLLKYLTNKVNKPDSKYNPNQWNKVNSNQKLEQIRQTSQIKQIEAKNNKADEPNSEYKRDKPDEINNNQKP